MIIKQYSKIIPKNGYALAAIYEPHPFRNSAIKEAVEQSGRSTNDNTGISDTEWCWVYYDWCGNPIGISDEKPDGIEVDKFTTDNLNFSWTTPECAQNMVDYLNKEPNR